MTREPFYLQFEAHDRRLARRRAPRLVGGDRVYERPAAEIAAAGFPAPDGHAAECNPGTLDSDTPEPAAGRSRGDTGERNPRVRNRPPDPTRDTLAGLGRLFALAGRPWRRR